MKNLIKFLVVILILVAIGKGGWMYIMYILQGGALSSADKKLQAELSNQLKERNSVSLESDLFPKNWDVVCVFDGSRQAKAALEYLNIPEVSSYKFKPNNQFILDGYWGMAFIYKHEKTVRWHEFYGPGFYSVGQEICANKESGLVLQRHKTINIINILKGE